MPTADNNSRVLVKFTRATHIREYPIYAAGEIAGFRQEIADMLVMKPKSAVYCDAEGND
jgi:hypothetical protein